MGKFENEHIIPRIRGQHLCYTRFKDDIFFIWTGSEKSLLKFFNDINKIHNSIKFECKYSYKLINFLDANVHLNREGLSTSLYSKPTDRNAYLHYASYHPLKQLQNIPYGQYLRAKKLCSEPTEADSAMKEIEKKFLARGYPSKETSSQLRKTSNVPREALLEDRPKSMNPRTPFTTTYNKNLPPVQRIINKHWHILHTHNDISPAFQNRPVLAYKRNKNLRNLIGQMHLSRGRKILSNRKPKLTGCSPCLSSKKNKCCRQITSSKTFTSDQTGETLDIRHLLTCKSTNCIYLGYCLKCPKHQYVGKSEPPAHLRFNTHRHDVNSPTGLAFDRHFDQPGHNFDHDARFILIEQITNRTLSKEETRKLLEQREDFWMQRLQTLAPKGLNDRLNSPAKAKIHAICT